MSQKSRAHGPAPMMTRSQVMVPLSVSTAEIEAEPLSEIRPFTSTPDMIRTPSASTFLASPYIDLVLLEYPPFFS